MPSNLATMYCTRDWSRSPPLDDSAEEEEEEEEGASAAALPSPPSSVCSVSTPLSSSCLDFDGVSGVTGGRNSIFCGRVTVQIGVFAQVISDG